jgi:hypothetical protein
MVIRAIIERGKFRPLDPIPSEWHEGQELNLDVLAKPGRPENSGGLPGWSDLEQVWAECDVNSGQPRPRRDDLHDRD